MVSNKVMGLGALQSSEGRLGTQPSDAPAGNSVLTTVAVAQL